MSECYINDAHGPCHCENCGWRGEAEKLNIIADIEQRLTPGCPVPAGECPECGALAYQDKSDYVRPPDITVADLKSIRTFIGFTQAYEQRKMTAGESQECDRLVKVINSAISRAESAT